MDIEAEIRRVAKLLETEIHVAGSSKRAVEKKLDVAAGYLTKVVKGGIEFRLRHILAVAEVTGFDVAEFFHKAFPRKPGASGEARTLQISDDELVEKIDRALARQLRPIQARLAALESPPASPPAEEAAGRARAKRTNSPPAARQRTRRPGRRT